MFTKKFKGENVMKKAGSTLLGIIGGIGSLVAVFYLVVLITAWF